MEGWITLNRKILDWDYIDSPNTLALFVQLLLRANYEDGIWKGKMIQRGQIVTSISKLSAFTGLSDKAVRIALDKLEKCGTIGQTKTNKYTIITICNYDDYQECSNNDIKNEGTQNGTQKDTHRGNNKQYNNIIESFTNVNNSSVHEKESKEKKSRRKKAEVITDKKGNPVLFASDEGRKPQQRKKEFNPPAINDVVYFFESRGLDREKAELFFYHYDGLGWKNTNGTKIHNWESTANKWILEEKQKSNSNLKQNERASNFRSVDDIAEQDRAKRQQEVAELVRQSLYDDSGPVASDVW